MALTDSDKVIQELNRRFAAPLPEFYARRIIFWYDEDRDFEEKVQNSEIKLADAKLIALNETNISFHSSFDGSIISYVV